MQEVFYSNVNSTCGTNRSKGQTSLLPFPRDLLDSPFSSSACRWEFGAKARRVMARCAKLGTVFFAIEIGGSIVLVGLWSAHSIGPSNVRAASITEAQPLPDQDAVLDFVVGLNVIPQMPTLYDRTTIAIVAGYSVEIVELFDETRGLRGSTGNRSMTLEGIFGPKTGLANRITVRATVRLRGQPGEKTIRRTIEFRNVPPEVWTRAENQGSIVLIVHLDVPVKPELDLSPEEKEEQRAKVISAQDQLLTALEGTDYKLIRRFEVTPGCTLELKPAALSVLDRLPYVLKVSEEEGTFILRRTP